MVSKGRHPKAPIAKALDEITGPTLVVEEIHRGHRWGKLTCTTCGTTVAIWTTPRVPDNHANDLRRFARRHNH